MRLKLEGGKRRPASQERADVQAKPREAEPVVVCTEEGASRASDLVSVRASGAEDRYVADGFYRRDAWDWEEPGFQQLHQSQWGAACS